MLEIEILKLHGFSSRSSLDLGRNIVTAKPINTTTTFESSTTASTTPNNRIDLAFNDRMPTKSTWHSAIF